MRNNLLIIYFLSLPFAPAIGQHFALAGSGHFSLPDSIPSDKLTKKRVLLVTAINVVGYGGTMIGLYNTWYKNYPQSAFHFINDMAEWKQVDKVGHFYSAYQESRASTGSWRWTGIDRKKYIWIGGMSGILCRATGFRFAGWFEQVIDLTEKDFLSYIRHKSTLTTTIAPSRFFISGVFR